MKFFFFFLLISIYVSPAILIAKDDQVKIVAHRGASHLAPENTLAAFKLAYALGADAIEGDFRLTKDHQIICIHDKNTKRTSNQNLTVSKSTLTELKTLDAGSWKDTKWKDEHYPTLKEVLNVVPHGKIIIIEIKSDAKIVPFIKAELAQSTLQTKQVIFISFNLKVVQVCKKELPAYRAFWLVSFKQNVITGKWKPTRRSVITTAIKLKADGVSCRAIVKVVDAKFVKSLRDAKLEFHAWTIDDSKTARYFQQLGVDSITTNRPKFIRNELESLPIEDQ